MGTKSFRDAPAAAATALRHVQGWRQNLMLDDREALLRRLHELRSEHRDLDTVIARLVTGVGEQLQLQRLKKRKLKLKDEITWLESQLVPDIIA